LGGADARADPQAGFISSDRQFEDFLESMGERDPLCTISDVAGTFGASHKIRGELEYGSMS
jgi:hypothetical protein